MLQALFYFNLSQPSISSPLNLFVLKDLHLFVETITRRLPLNDNGLKAVHNVYICEVLDRRLASVLQLYRQQIHARLWCKNGVTFPLFCNNMYLDSLLLNTLFGGLGPLVPEDTKCRKILVKRHMGSWEFQGWLVLSYSFCPIKRALDLLAWSLVWPGWRGGAPGGGEWIVPRSWLRLVCFGGFWRTTALSFSYLYMHVILIYLPEYNFRDLWLFKLDKLKWYNDVMCEL